MAERSGADRWHPDAVAVGRKACPAFSANCTPGQASVILKRGFRAATYSRASRSAAIEARVAVPAVPLPGVAKLVPRLGVAKGAGVTLMRERMPMFMAGRVWLLRWLLRRLRLRESSQSGGRFIPARRWCDFGRVADAWKGNKPCCGRGSVGRESRIRVNGGLRKIKKCKPKKADNADRAEEANDGTCQVIPSSPPLDCDPRFRLGSHPAARIAQPREDERMFAVSFDDGKFQVGLIRRGRDGLRHNRYIMRRSNKPTLIQIILWRRNAQARFRVPGLISAVGEPLLHASSQTRTEQTNALVDHVMAPFPEADPGHARGPHGCGARWTSACPG